MRSLLKSKKIVAPDQSVRSNAKNGSDAETLAASLMVSACRGEVCWGSREEDNSKIDLILSTEHPWYSKERMLVLIQVKSGATYGRKIPQGFYLESAAIKAAIRTSHAICVVWVCRETNEAFWSYVHPESRVSSRAYGLYHRVSPATLYDLARCMSKTTTNEIGGTGIIIRRKEGNLSNRRKLVFSGYKNLEKIFSPTLGYIECTRLGWRHMFRANRSANYKQMSLDLIPYLEKIVSQAPTDHAITSNEEWKNKNFIYRSTEHLLKYEKVMCSTKKKTGIQPVTAIIKVIEEIRYPKSWQKSAMLSQHIDRRVVLKSAYYKIKGES